jgi:hypothetical protein
MSEPENVFKTNKNILKYPSSVTKLYDTSVLSQITIHISLKTNLLTPYPNPKIKTKKKHTKANRCNDFNQKTALPIR